MQATEAAASLGSLFESLKSIGVEKQLAGIEELYADELVIVRDTYSDLVGRNVLTEVDAVQAETLIRFDELLINERVQRYSSAVRSEVMRNVILGQKTDIDALQGRLLPGEVNNIKTELNTGMAAFNRTVMARKAIDTFGKNPRFLYIGPLDKVTRDFCGDVLTRRSPPIYTLNEILKMNNDQGLDVLTSGGGFNCRHQWRPISPELERALRGN